ncbi:MAG: hypothetical protein GX052_03235 [Syntrophomonadaceae bacterium]|nr:hypothetical protein [Syntrophomonadaceae bacterium]
MWGEKTFFIIRPLLGLVIAVLVVALLHWLKIANPRQAVFNCSRFLSLGNTLLLTRDYEQMETEHFTVRFSEGDHQNAAIVAEAAEEIYEPVTQMFNYEPPASTVIVLHPDSTSLAKAFGWDRAEKAMGVYWRGTIRILNPDEWITDGDKRQTFMREGPMAHEFAHLLVDCLTLGNYPRWYTEGIAQYVEKKITGFELYNPAKYNDESAEYYKFTFLEQNFDELDPGLAYGQSLQAVELIAAEYGEDMVFQILDYLRKGDGLQQSFAKATGKSFDTFEKEFLAGRQSKTAV